MPNSNPATHAEDAVKRFGLESLPESVVRLTGLVARQDAVTGDIAALIAKDKSITARLLRYANPRADSEQDYGITTVEDALLRTGMAPVFLLALLDPLTRAVVKAFEMFQTPVTLARLDSLTPFVEEHVLGVVEFSGKAAGVVHIRLAPRAAQQIAAAILGVNTEDLTDLTEINDVIGELVNIVAGNLKSNLCDSGIPCKLTAPQVSRTDNFLKLTVPGGVSDRLGFAGHDLHTFVDVSVNPWNE